MQQIGKFLRHKREGNGQTQEDIALVLGYRTAQFISNWERGIALPPANKIKPLSRILGADYDELLNLFLDSKVELLREQAK